MNEYTQYYESNAPARYYDCEGLPLKIGVLFGIFRNVWEPAGRSTNTPERYMKHCEAIVKPIGRVFVWLGLAVPDDNSPFGFSGTPRLIGALVRQTNYDGGKVRPAPSVDDDALFWSILNIAYDSPEEAEDFVEEALIAAGLAIKKKGEDDVIIPTKMLRKMVADRRRLDWEKRTAKKLAKSQR
jgi:hypothetical protein